VNTTQTPQTNSTVNVEIEVEGLLFDMDGVLVQSTGGDERCWNRWAVQHGHTSFDFRRTHGRRAADVIRDHLPGVSDQTVRQHILQLDAFAAEEQSGVTAYPGVREILTALPPYRWTVVTSASESMMHTRLAAACLPAPRQAIGGDSVANGKPHPEGYLRGAALVSRQPQECLVIEDAPAGIRAGKAAGCLVLAVTSSHRWRDLQEADWVVGSFDQVRVSVTEGATLKVRFPALQRTS